MVIAAESASTTARWAAARRASSTVGSSASCSNRTRIRWRSSLAAASVKVIAAIVGSSTPRSTTRFTTRSTSWVVLPDPAPASTNSVSSSASMVTRFRSD
ncbi:MAG: hypothetical protein V9E99_03930 [Microthrixaceae bacterium]